MIVIKEIRLAMLVKLFEHSLRELIFHMAGVKYLYDEGDNRW